MGCLCHSTESEKKSNSFLHADASHGDLIPRVT